MILWNNTSAQWSEILGRYFYMVKYDEINYEEQGQNNRMYLLVKQSGADDPA